MKVGYTKLNISNSIGQKKGYNSFNTPSDIISCKIFDNMPQYKRHHLVSSLACCRICMLFL